MALYKLLLLFIINVNVFIHIRMWRHIYCFLQLWTHSNVWRHIRMCTRLCSIFWWSLFVCTRILVLFKKKHFIIGLFNNRWTVHSEHSQVKICKGMGPWVHGCKFWVRMTQKPGHKCLTRILIDPVLVSVGFSLTNSDSQLTRKPTHVDLCGVNSDLFLYVGWMFFVWRWSIHNAFGRTGYLVCLSHTRSVIYLQMHSSLNQCHPPLATENCVLFFASSMKTMRPFNRASVWWKVFPGRARASRMIERKYADRWEKNDLDRNEPSDPTSLHLWWNGSVCVHTYRCDQEEHTKANMGNFSSSGHQISK